MKMKIKKKYLFRNVFYTENSGTNEKKTRTQKKCMGIMKRLRDRKHKIWDLLHD